MAFTLRSFLRQKARRVNLCFSVQNDQDKKCETLGFEQGKSCDGFSTRHSIPGHVTTNKYVGQPDWHTGVLRTLHLKKKKKSKPLSSNTRTKKIGAKTF